jgi:hypothetical protein
MDVPVSAEVLRHSLDSIKPQLESFALPEGPFDPSGSWSQTYHIWPMKLPPKASIGHLTIQRTAQSDGAQLQVEQELRIGQHTSWSKASIECAADRWSTPRRFTVETWIATPDGRSEEGSQGKFSAEVVGQEIRYSGSRKSPVHVGGDWTLDWTLLSAIEQLPFQAGGVWQLDLVEDCDLLRPRQRLVCAGPLSVSLGGKTTELCAFCRTGTGTLPIHYWLDQQHRLLFVVHYYRTFIFESGPRNQGKGK